MIGQGKAKQRNTIIGLRRWAVHDVHAVSIKVHLVSNPSCHRRLNRLAHLSAWGDDRDAILVNDGERV